MHEEKKKKKEKLFSSELSARFQKGILISNSSVTPASTWQRREDAKHVELKFCTERVKRGTCIRMPTLWPRGCNYLQTNTGMSSVNEEHAWSKTIMPKMFELLMYPSKQRIL